MTLSPEVSSSSISLKTTLPGPKSQALMERRHAAVAQGPFHITPIFAAKAQGAVLEDVDGNRFLDFASGIGVTNTGHNAPALVDAVHAQANAFLHTSFNVVPYEGYINVAERLNALTPCDFPKRTFLVNSGSEAVENAIKFARAFTGRQGVVCFDHAYHGRTYMAMTLTAKTRPYKYGFAPFNPEVYRAPFPYLYRTPDLGYHACRECQDEMARCACKETFKQFVDVVKSQIGEDQVAAVIIEPVAGEGGFIPAPAPFLRDVQQFCRDHGIVFIADEIQTGFGRTGTLFASEQLGIEPDLMVLAKGLAGGMPLSAVTGRAEVIDATGTGGAGGTYSGNPVACAAALAALDMFTESEILDNAKALGIAMENRMDTWAERFEVIGDVRGLGPMRAIELVKDRTTKEPAKELAAAIVKYGYEHGVILISAGTYGNVVRFLVPLVTTIEQLHEGLDVVEAALDSVS